jgi:predicted DNA-binding transcriptional regulator AlpA
MTAEGGRIVRGRSREGGKRSGRRLEPVIMSEVRGAGTARHRGGRPTSEQHQLLVMHLAVDWLGATSEPPERGHSDGTGFGDLVHSVFQWLRQPDGSAIYALRRYWAVAGAFRTRELLADFLRRRHKNLIVWVASGFRQHPLGTSPIVPSSGALRRPLCDGNDMNDLDALLTSREAAELLRLSERTLERHRTAGTGPRFCALGRAIRYRRCDLLNWIERAARQSTSAPAR